MVHPPVFSTHSQPVERRKTINRLMGRSSRCPIRSSHPMGTVKSRLSGMDPFCLRRSPANARISSRTSFSVRRPVKISVLLLLSGTAFSRIIIPPCTRVCAAISGVHDRDDYRLILPRHTPHRPLHIYSLSQQSHHRGVFAKRYSKTGNRGKRAAYREGRDPDRTLPILMGHLSGYKAPILGGARDSMPIFIYVARGYTTPMHRVTLPSGGLPPGVRPDGCIAGERCPGERLGF